jgi:hypothetical protein
MRSLAIARYRFLVNVRAAGWMFGTAIVMAAFPVLIANPWLPESIFQLNAVWTLNLTAGMVIVSYCIHIGVLTIACHVLALNGRRSGREEVADLLEAAPLTPQARFWGDAAGIFASSMTLHLVALPLLALVIALSPFSFVVFFWLEITVVALVLLDSSAASWNLHAPVIRLATLRTVGSVGVFAILLAIVTVATTRWRDLRDSLGTFVQWPTARSWAAVVGAIDNPTLYVGALFVVYASFIMFFYFRTVRTFERV